MIFVPQTPLLIDIWIAVLLSGLAYTHRQVPKISKLNRRLKSSTWQIVSKVLVSSSLTNTNIQYQYNNNDKPNPDDVVFYLYTTYDTNSFDPISITSSPMTLVHPREYHDV